MKKTREMALFEKKQVRRVWHEKEWWFVIIDVVATLSESVDPSGYLKDIKRRDEEIGKGWGQIATPLSINTSGGKQKINCANSEGILRIIQSIPSSKAENLAYGFEQRKMYTRQDTLSKHFLSSTKGSLS